MKPRIRLRRGVWACSLLSCGSFVPPLAHGYTPLEAFREWEQLCRLAGMR